MNLQERFTDKHPAQLVWRFSESLKFYQSRSLEITTINDETEKDEIRKIMHATLKQGKYPSEYYAHIETFERIHKNREVSATEKDFYSQMAAVYDDLKLTLANDGQINRIDNLSDIQKKVEQKINKLSKSYVGNSVQEAFRYYRNFYKTEKPLIRNLSRYGQLGFIFNPWYGIYNGSTIKTFRRRYNNLIKNSIVFIDEKAILAQSDNHGKEETEIMLSGHIADPFHPEILGNIMNNRKILFDPVKDSPKLEQYEGKITISNQTGEIKNAYLNICFSFGSNYIKQISYELTELNDEEIPIDEN